MNTSDPKKAIRFNYAGLDVRVTRNASGHTYSVQVLYQNSAKSLYRSKTKSVKAASDELAIDKATEFALEVGLENRCIRDTKGQNGRPRQDQIADR
jgi:hypothetical protein